MKDITTWFVLAPIFATGFLGMLAGGLFARWLSDSIDDIYLGMSAGLVVGALFGIFYLLKKIFEYTMPQNMTKFQNTTLTPVGPQIMEHEFWMNQEHTEMRRTSCGLTDEEWRKLAIQVYRTNSYTIAIFESIFGADGRTTYHRVANELSPDDIGILMRYGKGYAVTDKIGDWFFERLATGPYPYPIKPDVLKKMAFTHHTHTHTQEMEQE